jgi:dsDNA-binding SOS-regulon protein
MAISKKEADAWDRVLDAAADLAELIESSAIEIDEYDLEELTIFLATHGCAVRNMLKHLKRSWPLE